MCKFLSLKCRILMNLSPHLDCTKWNLFVCGRGLLIKSHTNPSLVAVGGNLV